MSMGSMAFIWKSDGFQVPCDRCTKESAEHFIADDALPRINGHYCDDCHKIVCKEVEDSYREQFRNSVKDFKSTVLFRKRGKWSTDEINRLIASGIAEVWCDRIKTRYLVLEGHHTDEAIAKALLRVSSPYTVTQVVGIDDERLPFLPFC